MHHDRGPFDPKGHGARPAKCFWEAIHGPSTICVPIFWVVTEDEDFVLFFVLFFLSGSVVAGNALPD
jgi:hypothetical protein